jgi:TrmH family RNA methyltransferase
LVAVTGPITSVTNTRIKALVKLRERRQRDETGTFIIEGAREVERALHSGVDIDEIFLSRELAAATTESVAANAGDVPVVELSDAAFRKASYRDRPDGILAVARQFPTDLGTLEIGSTPLVLVADGIEKPGNLGTMLRTAEAVGVDALVTADAVTDPFNPNVVRASMGSLFSVPLAVSAATAAIDWLVDRGIAIHGASPDGDVDFWDARLSGPTAVVVGSEKTGLSPAWSEATTMLVRIPMSGSGDSLNAAVSAALLLYEAVRQRR